MSSHPFVYSLIDEDGHGGRRYAADGPVELAIMAVETPLDTATIRGSLIFDEDGPRSAVRQVFILACPNYETADRVAATLKPMLAALTEAVRAPIPTRDDGHKHVVRLERFSRKLLRQATCEICMTTLVEDVDAWWRDPQRAVEIGPASPESTVKDEIEKWVNRGR